MTSREPSSPSDILVPLARCEPLPAVWKWGLSDRTSRAKEIIGNRKGRLKVSNRLEVPNGLEMDAALYAVRRRTGILDLDTLALPPEVPAPRLVMPQAGFAPDFFWIGPWYFASRRLREVLAQPAEVVDFVPAVLIEGGEEARVQDYALMRVRAVQPAMDLHLSVCDVREALGMNGEPLHRAVARRPMSSRMVLREDLRPRTDLFRIDEDRVTILATDALALRVLAAGLTGVQFNDPGLLDYGLQYRRLRIPGGVRLSPLCFGGWPPPPEVHVPILGWSPGDPRPRSMARPRG